MNNDMKWEAVDHDQLTIGQQVRVRPTDGKTWLEGQVDHITAFHGARIALEGTATTVHTDGRWDVERAVPERTLPTTDGYYVIPGNPFGYGELLAIYADGTVMASRSGTWVRADASAYTDKHIRLAPVTDIEEAEKRARTKALHEADALVKSKFAEHGRSMIGPHIIRNNFVEFHLDATEWDGSNV